LFDANLGDTHFNAMIDSTGVVRFGLKGANNTDVNVATAAQSFVADEWVHLAMTWSISGTSFQIYINGILAASDTRATAGALGELGDLTIGDNSNTYHPHGTANSADGVFDEFRVYAAVLSVSEIEADRDAMHVCPVASAATFAIGHDGAGINCLAEAVTVTAKDGAGAVVVDYAEQVTLATQSGAGSWSLKTGTGTFVDATAGEGLATYVFASTDAGVAEFWLGYVQGTTPLDLHVYQTSDAGVADDDSHGTLPFSRRGFTITASQLPNPPTDPIDDPVGFQIAETSYPVHIAAYGQTPTDSICGVIESYAGGQTLGASVTYDDPITGTRVPTLDGVSVGTSEVFASSHNVTFTAGRAAFVANYADAGRIALEFWDTAPAATIAGASNDFVVSPATLVITTVEETDGTPNPGATTATGPGFVAAGEAFAMTVEARGSAGSRTPNFGNEVTPEGIIVRASTLLVPAAGRNGTADDGAIGNGTVFTPVMPAGTFNGTTFPWNEVGIVRLTAGVADADYLGAGDIVGAETGEVG
jgi:MSHA biogenesis protein MshQ